MVFEKPNTALFFPSLQSLFCFVFFSSTNHPVHCQKPFVCLIVNVKVTQINQVSTNVLLDTFVTQSAYTFDVLRVVL